MPTSVIGGHIGDPVAQQFYFASLLLSGLVMTALWWYISSQRRLVDPDLTPRLVRRTHVISMILPMCLLILMGLVALGIGRLVNPLLLFAFATLCFIVLGVLEWREEDEPEESGGQAPAPAEPPEVPRAGDER